MKYNDYNIRKCGNEDINDILKLQDIIINGLEDKNVLRKNTKKMFEDCIKEPNLTLGIFLKKELIALIILMDAKGTNEDLSIGLERYSAHHSANFKLVLVKKEYRGNGLQKSLMWILEKYAYSQGYRSLCTTVSEVNTPSLRNIRESGYVIDHNAIKYGGLSRLVLYKNIGDSVSKYNKEILELTSLEENNNSNNLFFRKFDVNKCFKGSIDIATTGDILKYEDIVSGKTYYGIYVKKELPIVYFYYEDSKLASFQYCKRIGSKILKEVLINSIGD